MKETKSILISFAIALFGFLLIFSYISKKEKVLLELSTPVPVVVALKDIPAGTRLDESVIEVREFPRKFVQPEAVGNMKDAVEKTTLVPVMKDSQITGTIFVDAESGGIAWKIQPEYRAYSIAVSDVTGAGGLVLPGDRIDVLVTVEIGDFKEGQIVSEEVISKTIVENVEVLAVNRMVSKTEIFKAYKMEQESKGSLFSGIGSKTDREESTETMTLALLPENVLKVGLAQEVGLISVSLHSKIGTDDIGSNVSSLTSEDFLNIKKKHIMRKNWRTMEYQDLR